MSTTNNPTHPTIKLIIAGNSNYAGSGILFPVSLANYFSPIITFDSTEYEETGGFRITLECPENEREQLHDYICEILSNRIDTYFKEKDSDYLDDFLAEDDVTFIEEAVRVLGNDLKLRLRINKFIDYLSQFHNDYEEFAKEYIERLQKINK